MMLARNLQGKSVTFLWIHRVTFGFYRKKRKTPKSLASWDISVNFQTVTRYRFCKLLSIFKTFLILDFAVTTTSQFLRT
ncbi:hypothetical protein, partial [Methanosarcina mazei]